MMTVFVNEIRKVKSSVGQVSEQAYLNTEEGIFYTKI
jgi:hypothetical protein